ncbi:MAG: bifunctional 3'-5' exonuclease/DNA polymerase [Microbacteriaceae bacterium]
MVRFDFLNPEGEAVRQTQLVPLLELPDAVARSEVSAVSPQDPCWRPGQTPTRMGHPRWVWDDTTRWYPSLLAAGVRVERCVDLRLSHAILRSSELTASSALAKAGPGPWDRLAPVAENFREEQRLDVRLGRPDEPTLFDLDLGPETPVSEASLLDPHPTAESGQADPLAEFLRQRDAVTSSPDPGRIGLLLAAESAGALIAAEMRFAGLPWRADVHDRLLTALLGPRPKPGERPWLLDVLLHRIRQELDAPELNPDSPSDLLKALNRAGLLAGSTRSWELKKFTHPAIGPLLEYKKLARLLSANGWNWLDSWVSDGRFRPDYVVGGVVTGRWATRGGGALQLPKQVRGAVVADPGWKLVVADASQLEPRILAAMSGDRRMAEAGRSTDMYAAIVDGGAVATRAQAKVAMLGAMYGSTTGESGRLMPKLAKAYPAAIALVEAAAEAGEHGHLVSTRLGRSSPRPGAWWYESQAAAYGETATDAERRRARAQARSWGRFTRNFIVQGTAAEWALCWMAGLRRGLYELSGRRWLTESPHLVFFLHDEVVVHCPVDSAEKVAALVRSTAMEAGRLLFERMPVEFPVTVAIVDDYGQAT